MEVQQGNCFCTCEARIINALKASGVPEQTIKEERFSKLINLLTSQALYVPNENDLKITALNTLLTSMKTSNTAVITATTNVSNSRISRNYILYKIVPGLVDIAFEVKSYIKSVFGTKSPKYKQVSSIKFTRKKI